MKLKYTPAEIQTKIDLALGAGTVVMDQATFVGVKKPAKFVDKDFGEWWTEPYSVTKGHRHPKNAIASMNKVVAYTAAEMTQKINEIHNNRYALIEETYIQSKGKAWFYDSQKLEWFETCAQNLMKGCDNPSDRAGKIRVANTPMLQAMGLKRLKYVSTTGESITHLCNQYEVASAAYLILAKNVSTDFAIKALLSHIKDGKYQKYQSNLEVFFRDVFKTEFPLLTKWNKQPSETSVIKAHPDFRFEYSGKVIYVDVHGIFFHSEYQVDKLYHQDRAEAFTKAGLTYLQFFADEIFEKPEIIKSMVLSRLGLATNKFAARNLDFKAVPFKEAQEFFNKNHLMGYKSSKTLGLYDGDKLVSALSYRSKSKTNVIEVERFCTLLNSSCAGGFGKFLSELKKLNKDISSFCDLRYSNGSSYLATGFIKVRDTLGWQWTEGSHRYNRLQCIASNGLTEKQVADAKGWFKIFDAGQRKYLLKQVLPVSSKVSVASSSSVAAAPIVSSRL